VAGRRKAAGLQGEHKGNRVGNQAIHTGIVATSGAWGCLRKDRRAVFAARHTGVMARGGSSAVLALESGTPLAQPAGIDTTLRVGPLSAKEADGGFGRRVACKPHHV
jgi:hypothetical protein